MAELIKFCGQRNSISVRVYETVLQMQAVERARLKFSMQRNRIILVCHQSLDIFHTSLTFQVIINK